MVAADGRAGFFFNHADGRRNEAMVNRDANEGEPSKNGGTEMAEATAGTS